MLRIVSIACAVLGSASAALAAPTLLKKEPALGAMKYGEIVLVDDGSCPKGQVKEVMGGYVSSNSKRNFGTVPTSRTRKCVPKP